MKAPAMKSQTGKQDARRHDSRPDEFPNDSPDDLTDTPDAQEELDESELDERDLEAAHDELWEVFILDDDGEPFPDYGDFWFPDEK
jgi:hypothetical protein